MIQTIDFIFDFASPNAYFAYKVLPSLAAEKDAEINYIPCLLGGIFKLTGNQAPMMAFAGVKGKNAYMMLEIQRFIKRYELRKFQMNPYFPVTTLILMRGAIAAQQDGRLAEYIDVGLKAMWEDKENMADPATYVRVMNAGGFDGAALLERSKEPAIKAELAKNTDDVVARGAFGIPTFYVGKDMYFGKDRIDQVIEALS